MVKKTNISLYLLPPEVWEMIFSQLKQPIDLLNAMRTCTKWKGVLESEKIRILFQNVFPLIAKHLSANDILSCRRVSKRLKMIIDQLLQACNLMPSYSKTPIFSDCYWDPDTFNPCLTQWLSICYTFHASSQTLEKFIDLMDSQVGNPFIGRSVSFTFFTEQSNFHHRHVSNRSLMTFFTRFGHHVRKFTHSIPTVFTCAPDNVLQMLTHSAILHLPSILRRLSNLECLNVDWLVDCQSRYDDHAEGLDRVIFPAMINLTCLYFNVSGTYCVPFGLRLLQEYGTQLETFGCTGQFLQSHQLEVFTLNELLPNLKHFKGTDVTTVGLKKLSQAHWTLELLQLQSYTGEGELELADLWKTLRNFGESLVKLQIDVNVKLNFSGDGNQLDFDMPKLKQFGTLVVNLMRNHSWLLRQIRDRWESLEVLDCHLDYKSMKGQRDYEDMGRMLLDLMPRVSKVRFWYGYFNVYQTGRGLTGCAVVM